MKKISVELNDNIYERISEIRKELGLRNTKDVIKAAISMFIDYMNEEDNHNSDDIDTYVFITGHYAENSGYEVECEMSSV